jgi:hypothetical protein
MFSMMVDKAAPHMDPGKPFFHILNLANQDSSKFAKEIWYFDFFMSEVKERNYYSYTGSLTTPPCTEDVQWLVLEAPQYIAEKDFDALMKFVVKNNARSLQPLLNTTKVTYGKSQLHMFSFLAVIITALSFMF